MGQVIACCTVAEREANDDTIYRPPPQEIEQPWKEKIKTNEGKVVFLAVDPKFKMCQGQPLRRYQCTGNLDLI